MRALIALLLIAILMGLAGWITLGHSPGRTTINLETDEIKEDTKNTVEKAERAIEAGAQSLSEEDDGESPVEADSDNASAVDVDEEPVMVSPE